MADSTASALSRPSLLFPPFRWDSPTVLGSREGCDGHVHTHATTSTTLVRVSSDFLTGRSASISVRRGGCPRGPSGSCHCA